MAIDYEKLRYFVIKVLKRRQYNTFNQVLNAVITLTKEEGLTPRNLQGGYIPDEENIREIFHYLYIQGIIVFGKDKNNSNWPYFSITSYGERCLQENDIIPYDPDGYLKKLKDTIPDINEIALLYVTESLQTFIRGCYWASTVMLGCASEKVFLLLVESLKNAIQDPTQKGSFDKKTSGPFIKPKSDEFNKEINKIRNTFPKELNDDLDINLNSIFSLIRNYRNEVGHPTGKKIDRGTASANLILFVTYCKKAYDLINYFTKNKIKKSEDI